MNRLIIIGVWIATLIVDGIILPALTGLPSGLGIMVLLSALAITFGIHRWVIGLGIVLTGLTELILGAYFGTIIGAWIVMAWSWHILNRFLNIKSVSENDSFLVLMPFTLLGLLLFGLGESTVWAVGHFIYKTGFSITTLLYIFRSPTIFITMVVELVITLFIFRFIYSPKHSTYG